MVIEIFTNGNNASKKSKKRSLKTHQFDRLKSKVLQQQSYLVRWNKFIKQLR
jgi:hypothetical protein